MPITSSTVNDSRTSLSKRMHGAIDWYFSALDDLTKPRLNWDKISFLALGSLVLIWLFGIYSTWATWGNLSIDSGTVAYMTAIVSQCKMLYRHVLSIFS